MNPDPEKELVASFLDTGSEGAFRQLYRMHTPKIYAVAMHWCGYEKANAEDIVQEVWIKAIRSLERFQWRSLLRTWLIGITINCCRDHAKKQQAAALPLNGMAHDPFTVSENRIDLQAALRKLPDGYREILILHDFEGFTHEEIGQLLGISAGTSKSQLFHARKAIKKVLV